MTLLNRARHRKGDWLLQLPKALFLRFYGIFINVKVYGRTRLPERKDLIIAVNHKAGIDPIAVQIGLRERIFFATDGQWFNSSFGRFFFGKLCDGFPVYNEKGVENIPGMRQCLEFLRMGFTVGIFPEGRLVRDCLVGEIQDGAAYISVKSGVPIVPVYIHYPVMGPDPGIGFQHLPLVWEGIISVFGNIFRRIKIIVGDPIWPDRVLMSLRSHKASIRTINKNIFEQFHKLGTAIERKAQFGKGPAREFFSTG
jgi:1-acyl-sn-glycerol-3-phosphate acyltransferase